jgi:hypothetical protein
VFVCFEIYKSTGRNKWYNTKGKIDYDYYTFFFSYSGLPRIFLSLVLEFQDQKLATLEQDLRIGHLAAHREVLVTLSIGRVEVLDGGVDGHLGEQMGEVEQSVGVCRDGVTLRVGGNDVAREAFGDTRVRDHFLVLGKSQRSPVDRRLLGQREQRLVHVEESLAGAVRNRQLDAGRAALRDNLAGVLVEAAVLCGVPSHVPFIVTGVDLVTV